MSDIQNILNKIALLKNLKERAGTPAEAAEAASRIQALMTRHNLTMFQVANAKRSDDVERPKVTRDWYIHTYSGWAFHLLASIGRANYVEVLHSSGADEFILIGHKHNIELVKHLFEYLEPEISRLANEAWKSHTPELVWRRGKVKRFWGSDIEYGWFPETPTTWKNNFRYGAASEVGKRLKEENTKVVDHENSNALVLVVEQEVKDAVQDWYPSLRKGSGPTNRTGGWSEGRAAGRNINLARQIGG